MGTLLGRHRGDDRLQAVQVAVVDLQVPDAQGARAGEHLQEPGQRSHPSDLLHLAEEVVEGELLLADLALEVGRLVLVELLLRLLDQRHHVAHAEDALRHPVGVEALEGVELLAGRGVHDRLAGDGLHRQRGSAARVAVELGQHDAVEVRGPGEALGDVDRVLAGHRVDHEQDVVRLHPPADARELLHELGVHVQPARRVDDQHVPAVGTRLVERPSRDVHRVAVRALLVHRRAPRPAHLHELLHGGWPVHVAGREGHVLAVLLTQVAGELGAGRGLTRALEPGHQHDGGRLAGEGDVASGAAHQRRELLAYQLDHLLPRVERLEDLGPERPLLDLRRERLDDLEVHVGLEQREPDLAHRLRDVVLGQLAARADVRQRRLKPI